MRVKRRFRRQHYHVKRVKGKGWRKPRGQYSKQRLGKRFKGSIPRIGFRSPRETRGMVSMLPGLREVLVHNARELSGLDSKRHCVRIARVSKRKRAEIIKGTKELGFSVTN